MILLGGPRYHKKPHIRGCDKGGWGVYLSRHHPLAWAVRKTFAEICVPAAMLKRQMELGF